MGRKPNQAIRWFFERGPKLDDNSNRYQQTCKRCGEKFEKGRHEALVSHIARSCQGVSFHEREKFLTEVSWTKPAAKSKGLALPVGGPTARPVLTGLDALAEVSTHHGHVDSQPRYNIQRSDSTNGNHMLVERHLPRPGSSHPSNLPVSGSGVYSNLTSHVQHFDLAEASGSSSHLQLAALRALVPNGATHDEHLRREPQPREDSLVQYGHGDAPVVDGAYSRHALQADPLDESPSPGDDLVDYNRGQAANVDEPYQRSATTEINLNNALDPDIPSSDPTSDVLREIELDNERERNAMSIVVGYVNNQKTTSPQMQLLSGEEPDDGIPVTMSPVTSSLALDPITAQSFHYGQTPDTAASQFQIWSPNGPALVMPKKVRGAFAPDRRDAVKEVRKKGACLRCRMLKKSCDSGDPCKECAKLENARMWKGQCLRTRPQQIFNVFSSTLFMGTAHKAIEAAKELAPFTPQPGRLEVSFHPTSGVFLTFACLSSAGSEAHPACLLMAEEDEHLPHILSFSAKANRYGAQLLALHYADPGTSIFPISRFMHETLRIALTLQSRILIARAIELWLCVTMLVAPPDQLLVVWDPHLASAHTLLENHTMRHVRIDNRLVYLQLRRKLEKTADAHFKAVMNELEKALVQRKQADNYETFIGSVILLRCLEETCYLYKGFDALLAPSEEEKERPSQHVLVDAAEFRWPLANPPSHYWQQGEQFSDLLISMLRLRKVPPQYVVRDGRVVAGNAAPESIKDWFERVDLGADAIEDARGRDVDEADGAHWELRWIGKVFEV